MALAAYLILLGVFLARCWKIPPSDPRRPAADRGLIAVFGLTVAGFFEYNFGDTEVLLTLLAVMALTLAALRFPPTQAADALPGAVPAGEGAP